MIRLVRPLVALTAATVVLASLTACGGDADPGSAAPPEPSESATQTTEAAEEEEPEETEQTEEVEPYLPVPDGVELTPQGSALRVGDSAVVAFEPRQGVVGALDITVTRLERTTLKESFSEWVLDEQSAASAPYFVRARITNVGDADLGGRPVPLYVEDGTDRLLEPTGFTERFEPCPQGLLPKQFASGDTIKVCLVYLAADRGELTAVTFRPGQNFDPITWTGKILDLNRSDKPGGDKSPDKQG